MHLDHSHEQSGINAGRCRGLLHPACNTLEGTILHKWNRSGLKNKADYLVYLKNLVVYLEQDYSKNKIHPKHVPDMVKSFKRLTLSEMKTTLETLCDTQVTSKQEAIKTYTRELKMSLG